MAARRRTSDTRCWSEEVERKLILMLYLPPDALLQSAAAVANEPDGSGNTYQLTATGPLLEEPQPTTNAATTARPTITTARGDFSTVAPYPGSFDGQPLSRSPPLPSLHRSLKPPVIRFSARWHTRIGESLIR